MGDYYGYCDAGGRPVVSFGGYYPGISRGLVKGHTFWSKVGVNLAVGSTEEVLSPQGGAYVFMTAAQGLEVYCSATADGTGETGINTLTLYGLNNAYEEISETVTLTGVTTAAVVRSDWYRLQNVSAATVGAGGVAADKISIFAVGGGVTFGYIAKGHTRQRQMVWTVPAGRDLYIREFHRSNITAAANKYCTITLKATYDDKLGERLTSGRFFMPYAETSLESGVSNVVYDPPLRFPAKTDLIVVAAANSSSVTQCTLRGWTEVTQ